MELPATLYSVGNTCYANETKMVKVFVALVHHKKILQGRSCYCEVHAGKQQKTAPILTTSHFGLKEVEQPIHGEAASPREMCVRYSMDGWAEEHTAAPRVPFEHESTR